MALLKSKPQPHERSTVTNNKNAPNAAVTPVNTDIVDCTFVALTRQILLLFAILLPAISSVTLANDKGEATTTKSPLNQSPELPLLSGLCLFVVFKCLPFSATTDKNERNELLLAKLRRCTVLYDFTHDSTADLAGKEAKRLILIELIEYTATSHGAIPEPVYIESVKMVR